VLTDVRDISKIAYGFMATQALVAALDLDLFGRLREGPATLGELADRTGLRADRLALLLTALLALGLLIIVHDFMVDEDLTGPAAAALWMLVLVTSPDPVCLTAGHVSRLMQDVGLEVVADDLVPTITKVVVGVKPARGR
jgi:DNA-binding IclR family transcriptional regulator